MDLFKEKDKTQVIEFLNFVAKKATFNDISIEDNIKLFKLLSYMQIELLKKIDNHLFDNIQVTQVVPEGQVEEPKKKSGKGAK